MKKIRLLIAAALFACVISAVSCGGASAAGTATVSDNQGVFGNGSLKSGETLAATSIVTVDLANVVYADDFTAADDAALVWFKCKDGDGNEIAVESLGGIKATASPASSGEGKKDRIAIAFSAERLAATDTILTSVVIPAEKLSSKSSLPVKLGDDGIRIRIVNAGVPKYDVDGATFVSFSGETGAPAASNVTVSYKITDAFVIVGENPVYTNVDVTDWFELKTDGAKKLSDIKIKAKADFTSSQDGQNAPKDTMTVTFSTQDSSTEQANAANPGDRSYKLVIPSENLKNSPEGILIDDAVRVIVTKKNADRSASADDGAATPGDVVVMGQTGYALDSGNQSGDAPAPYVVTITLDGDYFMNLAADEGKTYMTVNNWLGLLNEGWECVIGGSDLAAAANGSNKVRISISGKVA